MKTDRDLKPLIEGTIIFFVPLMCYLVCAAFVLGFGRGVELTEAQKAIEMNEHYCVKHYCGGGK